MQSKLSVAPAAYTWEAAPPTVPATAGNYARHHSLGALRHA